MRIRLPFRRRPEPLACQELVELVTAYLEDDLSTAQRERFEAHIGDCPHCTAYLEQIRETIRLSGALTEESLPAHMRDELLAAFADWKAAG